jgi:hypothetical protein
MILGFYVSDKKRQTVRSVLANISVGNKQNPFINQLFYKLLKTEKVMLEVNTASKI